METKIQERFGERGGVFIRIANCESGVQNINWNNRWQGVTWEQAVREKRAIGLFQVYLKVHSHHDPLKLLDADYNINVAWELSRGGTNLKPWEASQQCWQS